MSKSRATQASLATAVAVAAIAAAPAVEPVVVTAGPAPADGATAAVEAGPAAPVSVDLSQAATAAVLMGQPAFEPVVTKTFEPVGDAAALAAAAEVSSGAPEAPAAAPETITLRSVHGAPFHNPFTGESVTAAGSEVAFLDSWFLSQLEAGKLEIVEG